MPPWSIDTARSSASKNIVRIEMPTNGAVESHRLQTGRPSARTDTNESIRSSRILSGRPAPGIASSRQVDSFRSDMTQMSTVRLHVIPAVPCLCLLERIE